MVVAVKLAPVETQLPRFNAKASWQCVVVDVRLFDLKLTFFLHNKELGAGVRIERRLKRCLELVEAELVNFLISSAIGEDGGHVPGHGDLGIQLVKVSGLALKPSSCTLVGTLPTSPCCLGPTLPQ